MLVFISILVAVLALAISGGIGYQLWENIRRVKGLQHYISQLEAERNESQSIISARDGIIANAKQQCQALLSDAESRVGEFKKQEEMLKSEITDLVGKSKELQGQIRSLTESFEFSNLNFYAPHYNFEKALDFERALYNNRESQKALVKANTAIVVQTDFANADKKTIALLSKFLIRTFNSESDLLMKNVDYKNIVVYESRLNNSYEQLNKLTLRWGVALSDEFLKLKIAELRLCHEHQEKIHQEAEEQRQIKEIMREELRAEREMEKAKEDAEKEMQRYQELIARAMNAAQSAHGAEIEKKNAQIAVLQEQLQAVVEKVRSISQAQQTKTGYVYVISNIGSFGDGIFKIGMTRRLDPQERVDELGDASVPFAFDVHAMIRHDNAPELETKLHQRFENNRVNKINSRKEFFKVSLDEIEVAAREFGAQVQFTRIAEAKEYRESLAIEQRTSA